MDINRSMNGLDKIELKFYIITLANLHFNSPASLPHRLNKQNIKIVFS